MYYMIDINTMEEKVFQIYTDINDITSSIDTESCSEAIGELRSMLCSASLVIEDVLDGCNHISENKTIGSPQ